MPIHLYLHKLSRRAQLRAHSLPDNHILKSLLEARPNLNTNPHCLSLESLTLFQRAKIKEAIINMDNRFNEIYPAFDLLNNEFSSRLRIVDIFTNHFSFYSFIKNSKDSFKSHLLLLSDLTISSSLDSLHIPMVTDVSIKHNVIMSITYIYISNKDITKMIYYMVNILSTEAELIAIRCGINQSINISGISKIIVITDFLYIVRKIFNSFIHPYQKYIAAILYKLRRFFLNNVNNLIEFCECPSQCKWSLHKVVDTETKHFRPLLLFPCKSSWEFSRKSKCNNILSNWKMTF